MVLFLGLFEGVIRLEDEWLLVCGLFAAEGLKLWAT